MKAYISSLISSRDCKLFSQIEQIMHEMPEVDLGKDSRGKVLISCHMLAQALAKSFSRLTYQHGYFVHHAWSHSWLLVDGGDLLIDPYPWLMLGGPIMIDLRHPTPWRDFYRSEDIFVVPTPTFYQEVEKVTQAVQSTMEKLRIPVFLKA